MAVSNKHTAAKEPRAKLRLGGGGILCKILVSFTSGPSLGPLFLSLNFKFPHLRFQVTKEKPQSPRPPPLTLMKAEPQAHTLSFSTSHHQVWPRYATCSPWPMSNTLLFCSKFSDGYRRGHLAIVRITEASATALVINRMRPAQNSNSSSFWIASEDTHSIWLNSTNNPFKSSALPFSNKISSSSVLGNKKENPSHPKTCHHKRHELKGYKHKGIKQRQDKGYKEQADRTKQIVRSQEQSCHCSKLPGLGAIC